MSGLKNKSYYVYCMDCGQDFSPAYMTSLWWQAKKHADHGYLDALLISGTKCGCKKKPSQPNAPFRVFGYDDLCVDFDVPHNGMIEAMKMYLECSRTGCVVFIKGVSRRVERRLATM